VIVNQSYLDLGVIYYIYILILIYLDKTLRLWEYPFTGKPKVFTGHTKDVLSCHFGANNRVIYSGSMDKTVKIWNVMGELKYTGTDFNGWVSCLTPIQGGKESSMMAVGSWDNKVRIFDKDFKLIKGIGSIDYPVVSMSVDDESGEFLFVAEKNGSIKIWALGGENQADELKQHYDLGTDIFAISYEPVYTSLFSVGTSNGLTIKDIAEGKDLFTFSYGTNVSCLSLAFDKSKQYLFAGFSDGLIRVYRFRSE
jgi:guanine nucleotide-binding protein subunit beta-2-like 1 protein